MKSIITLALLLTVLGTFSTAAHAFDNSRMGFQLGLGIGAHNSTVEYTAGFTPASNQTEQKLAVDLLVGYGFSNKIVGFLGGKGGSILIDEREGSLGISGIGGSVYLADSYPSMYMTGLVGVGYLSMSDEGDELNDTGMGCLASIGYEVTKGLHMELSYARADLEDPDNAANTSAVEMAFATFKYIWY